MPNGDNWNIYFYAILTLELNSYQLQNLDLSWQHKRQFIGK